MIGSCTENADEPTVRRIRRSVAYACLKCLTRSEKAGAPDIRRATRFPQCHGGAKDREPILEQIRIEDRRKGWSAVWYDTISSNDCSGMAPVNQPSPDARLRVRLKEFL
jgi:hypothetical protein